MTLTGATTPDSFADDVEDSSATANGRRRRDEIVHSAAEMFADHGYHAASLRSISGRVGISHPGMLHHFASKEDLLDTVIDRLEAHAQEALDRVDELCAEVGALQRGLAEVWHPASHPIQLLAMLDAGAVSDDHPCRYRIARLRRVHEHVLEECFSKLEERYLLREGIDPAFAGRATLALILNLALREKTVRAMQREPHDDAPIKDLVTLTRSFFELGSTGEGGRHLRCHSDDPRTPEPCSPRAKLEPSE